MKIDYDTYEKICDLLIAGTEDEPTYSVDEIAEMIGVTADVVRYVDRSENGAF